MYLKSIELENTGPIDSLAIQFHEGEGNPKPTVIVGENGSGKSIVLSHIVNGLICAKQEVFEDGEVEKGKVYKMRHPQYIKSGSNYSYCRVDFSSNLRVIEWQLVTTRSKFEENFGFTPMNGDWNSIIPNEASRFWTNFSQHRDDTEKLIKNQCALYFPVNRFEEPGWLNIESLTTRAKYSELKRIQGYSNRNLICASPLKENRDWLLDLLFDRFAFELKTPIRAIPQGEQQAQLVLQVFDGFKGQSSSIYEAVLKLLRVILRVEGNIRLGFGNRRNRQIAIVKNETPWIPNLFQLSTGEVLLSNLFLSILRDYDLSHSKFDSLEDVQGVVVIDEIDAHLHTGHQMNVLPELIASFPKVQFIVTTHSPLFVMGMVKKFGDDGFNIVDLPKGNRIAASDFSEFVAAYNAFKETEKYREEIATELTQSSTPIVFVEGDYDVRYLERAADLLGKRNVLGKVRVKAAGGFGNLDKMWKDYNNPISSVVPGKIILLYDCDIKRNNADCNNVYRRVMPSIDGNPIAVGIENLFSRKTIEGLEAVNTRFIDLTPETVRRVRGEDVVIVESRSVNRDEKGNMCTWLCENGQQEDFVGFAAVFSIIEDIVEA
jgi:predicted ATP-binding protein involved in virulence